MTKSKRILPIIISVIMIFTFVPIFSPVTYAEGPMTPNSTITLEFTSATTDSSGTGWSWEHSTNTLTLTDLIHITTAKTALRLPDKTTIVLNGTNIIKSGDSSTDTCGIDAGDLTIGGNGSLISTAGDTTNIKSTGINAGINISINESATVTGVGGTTSEASYGIWSSGNLEINSNAVVTGIGDEAPNASCGIYTSNSITIGGNATVTATTTMAGAGFGFYSPNSISISGNAKVTATGGNCAMNKDYTVPTGFKYYVSTTTTPSTSELTGNDSTSIITSSYKYAKIMENIPPTLSSGSVNRTSDTEATMDFATNEAGQAYYLVKNSGETVPTKPEVKAGNSLGVATVGANTGKAISLTAGAKDIYVVVEDAASNISEPLKIEVSTYVKPPIDISKATITIPDKTWTGSKIKPTSFVYDGKTYPISGNATVVSYGTNKKIGKGTIKITGRGDFTGSKTIPFKINPKKNKVKKVATRKKKMTVKWSKVSAAQKVTKYQIRYRVKGTTNWKIETYKASAKSAVIKGLKKGKKYQVQTRSYKKVSKVEYYSTWSATKTSGKIA